MRRNISTLPSLYQIHQYLSGSVTAITRPIVVVIVWLFFIILFRLAVFASRVCAPRKSRESAGAIDWTSGTLPIKGAGELHSHRAGGEKVISRRWGTWRRHRKRFVQRRYNTSDIHQEFDIPIKRTTYDRNTNFFFYSWKCNTLVKWIGL